LNEEEKAKLGRTGGEFARAKEIIEKHRGKIWVEFSEAEGTLFHILLPIWEKRARPEQ
jgi:signal transduction histidine kinase